MVLEYKCSCGETSGFEVYISLDLVVCRKCKKEKKLSEINNSDIKIQHQRG